MTAFVALVAGAVGPENRSARRRGTRAALRRPKRRRHDYSNSTFSRYCGTCVGNFSVDSI